MRNKELTRKKLLNGLACVLLVLAVALLVLTFLMQINDIAGFYEEFLSRLAEFEQAVASIPSKWLVILVVILIYAAKAIIPLPISAVCVIAGMVFPTRFAIIINVCGFVLLLTLKYFWGKHLGGGAIHKILTKYDNVDKLLESNNRGKDWLLFLFRLVPSFPINSISQLYGAMGTKYPKYLWLSLLGLLPKIISYSFIGRNVYNPFSLAFMLPIVILFIISGLSMLGVNVLLDITAKNKIKKGALAEAPRKEE